MFVHQNRPIPRPLPLIALLLVCLSSRAQAEDGAPQESQAARQDPVVEKWVATLREEFRFDAILSTVKIKAGILKPRKFVEGGELYLVCEGFNEGNRQDICDLALDIIGEDKAGQLWIADKIILVIDEKASKSPEFLKNDVRDEEVKQIEKLRLAVQDEIDLDPNLRGSLVSGIRFVTGADDTIELRLVGHLRPDADRQTIEEIARKAVRDDDAWLELGIPPEPSTEEMRSRQPSTLQMNRYFSMARKQFWKKDYSPVELLLSSALAEAAEPRPQLRLLRWKVVTALSNDQEDRAVRFLRAVLAVDPTGFSAREAGLDFERFQGRLRARLKELETQVLQGRRQ